MGMGCGKRDIVSCLGLLCLLLAAYLAVRLQPALNDRYGGTEGTMWTQWCAIPIASFLLLPDTMDKPVELMPTPSLEEPLPSPVRVPDAPLAPQYMEMLQHIDADLSDSFNSAQMMSLYTPMDTPPPTPPMYDPDEIAEARPGNDHEAGPSGQRPHNAPAATEGDAQVARLRGHKDMGVGSQKNCGPPPLTVTK